MARHTNHASSYYAEQIKKPKGYRNISTELAIREAYLRTSAELLDSMGVDDYSLDQIRGATMLLEKYLEVDKEINS